MKATKTQKETTTMTTTVVPPNGNNAADSALVKGFKAARRVSTPIVAVETPDAAATIATLRRTLPDKTPTLAWDCAKGLRGLNASGEAAFTALGVDPNASVNAVESLLGMEHLPEGSVVFLHNFHLQMTETPVKQALWNLRDQFKEDKRTAVVLGPGFTLPAELSGDVIVLEEALPTRAELSVILDQQFKNVNDAISAQNHALKMQGKPELPLLDLPDAATRTAVLDAVVGLASYTAEQVMAMAIEKTGINVEKCWERKIKAIENTPGLSVYKPNANETTLDELKGIDNVVAYAKEWIDAEAFNLIVFLDEMDKELAGGMSDHVGDSGVGKYQVKRILSYMNDTKSPGLLLAGVAGSGKSQLPKAMAAAMRKPLIVLDLGEAKGGIVGTSEANIANILKVITATAEGRVLFIGTANRTTIFTPEMNRRFSDQFFFDILEDEGRKAIWPVYIKKNGLTPSQAEIPAGFDKGWTGAEIQRACERAALFGKTVVESARFIIPQAVSAQTTIAKMRQESAGKFLSASKPGFYTIPVDPAPARATGRAIDLN
jgi:ATPase family associated with various cellular activities (AAA)